MRLKADPALSPAYRPHPLGHPRKPAEHNAHATHVRQAAIVITDYRKPQPLAQKTDRAWLQFTRNRHRSVAHLIAIHDSSEHDLLDAFRTAALGP